MVRYRSLVVFSLTGWSPRIGQDFSCPGLLRCRLSAMPSLRIRAISLCALLSRASAEHVWPRTDGLPNPGPRTYSSRFWAVARSPSPLLAQCAFAFFILRVMRCFSSPGSPPVLDGCRASTRRVATVRKSVSVRVFAPQHGLSQVVTSLSSLRAPRLLHVPFLLSVSSLAG